MTYVLFFFPNFNADCLRSKNDFISLEDLPNQEIIVESPGFPESYDTGLVKIWHYKSNEGKQIRLQILDLSVRTVHCDSDCTV